jgi:hypothetical protein
LDKKPFSLTIKVLRIFSSKKRGTKSSSITFDKPKSGVNVIGSPEGSGKAVQPEFHCSAFSRNETLAVSR